MAVVFILVATVVVVVVVLWFFSRRRSIDLPSPPGHPIVGNLFQIIRPRSDLWLTEWSHKLGPVFCVRMLHMNLLVVNDYDSIHTVLVKQGKDFAGRPQSFGKRQAFLRDYKTELIFNNPSPEWKLLRQTVHGHVKVYEKGLRRVESVNMAAIEDMVSELTRRGEEGPFNPRLLIRNTTMNIICVFLLGRTFTQDHPFFSLATELQVATDRMLATGSKGSELEVMWWLRHFGNKNYNKLQQVTELRAKHWGMVRDMVEEDLADSSRDKGGIIHDLLTAVRDKTMPDEIDEGSVTAVFYNLLAAGTVTTTSSFYSFLNIMACYPEVQARLRREVDDVVGAERAVSLDDRQSMPYTRATVIELNRYASVASLSLRHATLVDTSINGHHIPKETTVITNLWALHHDEKFWGDPWEFRPERFLDDQGELLAADHERRKHVLAFGAGPRVCLGETLGLGRLFLLVSTVVQRFELSPGPTPVSCDPRQYAPSSAIMNADYELRFTRRQAAM